MVTPRNSTWENPGSALFGRLTSFRRPSTKAALWKHRGHSQVSGSDHGVEPIRGSHIQQQECGKGRPMKAFDQCGQRSRLRKLRIVQQTLERVNPSGKHEGIIQAWTSFWQRLMPSIQVLAEKNTACLEMDKLGVLHQSVHLPSREFRYLAASLHPGLSSRLKMS